MTNQTRPYQPLHPMTENYYRGTQAIDQERLREAIEILSAEPPSSTCYDLARGNKALALVRLEKFEEAEYLGTAVLADLEQNGCPHPPSWIQFIRNYGEAKKGQGKLAEAVSVFLDAEGTADRLIEDYPEFKAEIEIQMAHVLNSCGSSLLQFGNIENMERGIEIFRKALSIYSSNESASPPGRSETLMNYGHALRMVEKYMEAEFAFKEALELAVRANHTDQIHAVRVALAQLSTQDSEPIDYEAILEASEAAAGQGRYSTAYLRLCICAQLAVDRGDFSRASSTIQRASGIERLLDPNDISPARLRLTQGLLLRQTKTSNDEIIGVLAEGAHIWFSRIGRQLLSPDLLAMTMEMHELFRLLSRCLLDDGRIDEALTSFEAGRAIAHAVEVDRGYLARVISADPFSEQDGTIILDSLIASRNTLAENEVCVTITILPPSFVAFVVSRETTAVCAIPIPDEKDNGSMVNEIQAIPENLALDKGLRAIPSSLMGLAKELVETIGNRVVRAVLPYASLHSVPWRVLLRHAGMPWMQIKADLEFVLFLRYGQASSDLPRRCIALGHGFAGTIDLADEAQSFADAFRQDGTYLPQCNLQDVKHALTQDAIVLISCHGSAGTDNLDRRLFVDLNDGSHAAEDCIPPSIKAPLVILSACESGVYEMAWGDFPIGASMSVLRKGAQHCIGTRFKIGVDFASRFFPTIAKHLAAGVPLVDAFAMANEEMEAVGFDRWRDIACVELLGGP